MMILDLSSLPLQLLVDRHLYNFYNDLVQWYLYNDWMQCWPLEVFMWWTSCCCSSPWLLLLSCYPPLHLSLLCYPRNCGPLEPLTTHDLAFSCLLGARCWIWCISVISYSQYVIFGSIVVIWVPGKRFSKYVSNLFFEGNILQFNHFLKHLFS